MRIRLPKAEAVVAVSHTLLSIIYSMLRAHVPYTDLGADRFERLDPERLPRYHVRRLQALGHTVTRAPLPDGA
jgi:transposase